MKKMLLVLFASALVANPLAVAAQQQSRSQTQATQQQPAGKFELTVDSIMRGPDLVGYAPTGLYWSRDNRRIYFRWKRPGEPRLKEFDLYVVDRDGSNLRKLSEEEARQAPPRPQTGQLSKDKRLTVFVDEGDVYLYDHERNERRRLTNTTETESNPHFTGDQRAVYFTRANNLYVFPLDGGTLAQLTDIRIGGGGGQQRGTDSQEVVKKENRELIEAVRERAERREEQEAKRKQRERRKPFNLPQGQSIESLLLSPDGKYVLALVNVPPTGAKNTIVPNYVTESGYTEDISSRSKVGDAQERTRMALIDVETGDSKWAESGLPAEVKPEVVRGTERNTDAQTRGANQQQNQAQTGQAGQQTGQSQTGQQGQQGQQTGQSQTGQQTGQTTEAVQRSQSAERDVEHFTPVWSDDGTRVLTMLRSFDNKDRWVMLLDPATGKLRMLAHIRDEAWVNGPGGFTYGWLPDNQRVYFQSERDGFAHLYTVPVTGGEPTQLTSGQFEVSDVVISEDRTKFYLTSSEGSFFERHLYSMPLTGGTRTRLTTLPGNNNATVSPDETMLAIVRSYSNKPPEVYLQPNRAGAEAAQVTTSPLPEFFTHNWIDPQIVNFKARDGVTVYGRIYKPTRPARGGPAVLFVHGAGYLQNVHKWWSQYYREYMFHHLLAERGYTVLDIDYRGSAGYGRDWRTGIYRHMGGKDLTDHVDAVRYLVAEHGVDPKSVGIYGGSYGGFITFMAMFTAPDVFAAGASLRPVTDWAHYNHGYTSNILNTPQSDLEAYRRSSPIYFAEGLKGALLICHGMVDTNVHFQDTVRLVQRLIELRKENWELAVYPVEDHAFDRASSWADEYKRILKLFETNLKRQGTGTSNSNTVMRRRATR